MEKQKNDLEEYVRNLAEDLYKNGERIICCLGENVTWIGEKESEIYEGMEAVRCYLKAQKSSFPAYKIGKNSFRTVWEGNGAALVEGIYILEPLEGRGAIHQSSHRCSVLLEKTEGEYKIVHFHVSDCQENIVWTKELISQIQRDPLTQIYNVKTVREKVEEWLEERSGHEGCAMCMIDVDNFKNINDTLGHLKGNDILIQVAHILKSVIGKEDFAGRAGGDEFLVFLKNGSQERAEEFAGILMEKIRNGNHTDDGSIRRNISITVSIGIARTGNGAGNEKGKIPVSYKHLFRQADAALYMAKKKGKNTFHILNIGKQQTP